MIPKFYWISSIGFDDEAKAITYPQFYYKGQANTTIGMASIYTAGDGTQILVTEGGVIIGHPQQGFAAVEKIATNSGYVENPINATKSPGAVVIASNVAMYIRPEAENMLFTKLYLMNGAGLEHFEQVFNNGYLKTYYVDYA